MFCPAGAVRLLPDVAGKKELYTGDRVFSTATLKMGRGNSGKLVTEVKKAMLKAAPPCELAIVDGSPGHRLSGDCIGQRDGFGAGGRRTQRQRPSAT